MSIGQSDTDQSSTAKQDTTTNPWSTAIPQLQTWLNGLAPSTAAAGTPNATTSGALGQLITQAQAGNPLAPAVNSAVSGELNASTQPQQDASNAALKTYTAQNTPIANGENQDFSTNPQIQAVLQQIQQDTKNSVNGQFAGAGRDLSGANQNSVARGIASGEAPVLLNELNTQQARSDAASAGILGNTNATGAATTGFQTDQANIQNAGVTNEPAALAANQWGPEQVAQLSETLQNLPVDQLSQIAQILFPAAQLGGSSSGTKTGTSDSDTTSFGFKL